MKTESENRGYLLDFSDGYFDDVERHIKSGQKKVIEKIKVLLFEIQSHPTIGTGKPEAFKGYGERWVYSRRIDQKHRLVYEIFEEERIVEVLACYGHYED
ncbi:MAG: Txe/YoeB family addiction module toxin [Bergeyella zoohelcum]|nr:Txe/YoeB family addiction module toxin [Bergeyella zoohelcum]